MNSVFIAGGSVDISPRRPAMLGGYAGRTTPCKAIADPLEANVLQIEGDDGRVIVVSTDLLYPGDTLRTSLLRNLAAREEELFISAYVNIRRAGGAALPRAFLFGAPQGPRAKASVSI